MSIDRLYVYAAIFTFIVIIGCVALSIYDGSRTE
jgi:hypothetical protein